VENTLGKGILAVAGTALFVSFAASLWALPTMWLWNWLMPFLFGVPVITFWQALGISFLCGILFGRSNSYKSE
jgi:hypothetical protein